MCDSFHTLPANHRQQIVYVAMPHTETSKSQATNHTSCHASRRYHQITGNKSYILQCLTQMPANHRQQIVHLAMPHTDTSTSNVKRKVAGGTICYGHWVLHLVISHMRQGIRVVISHTSHGHDLSPCWLFAGIRRNNMCVTVSLP